MKTLDKLDQICKDHGCEMMRIYDPTWQEWNLIFFAPPKMQWNSATSTAITWTGSLKGTISFLRSELECGFSRASKAQLLETGQIQGVKPMTKSDYAILIIFGAMMVIAGMNIDSLMVMQ